MDVGDSRNLTTRFIAVFASMRLIDLVYRISLAPDTVCSMLMKEGQKAPGHWVLTYGLNIGYALAMA